MTRIEGHLLDVQPDGLGHMVAWVKTASGTVALREAFTPSFFVHAPPGDLARLGRRLRAMDAGFRPRPRRARLGLDRHKRDVLEVPVPHPHRLRDVATMVDRWGQHRSYDLYDVDLRESHRWFIVRGSFPLARVVVSREEGPREEGSGEEGSGEEGARPPPQARDVRGYTVPVIDGPFRWTTVDGQWDLDPAWPELKILGLEVETDAAVARAPGADARVTKVRLGETEWSGSEPEVLEGLRAGLEAEDPDVLRTRHGDSHLMAHLRTRAKATGVPLVLGRGPDPARPSRRGRSFFSYGQVKWQPPVETLSGRIHLDVASSFFHKESGLYGLMDLARIASCPLQELARLGPGTAVTAIQIDRAKREERLVPWKKNLPESLKSEWMLVQADRGGYIHDPKVGLFDDVVELDFASMYPNIMVTRNVSPETVMCPCCDPSDPRVLLVPQTGYVTCRRPGFVGRSIGPMIRRRETFKRRLKEHPEARAHWQGAADALKWLLVCSFGYQGYRNARFGRIECHEAICAWGREILLTTKEIARDMGFEVLHGIVDSLWVKRERAGADAAALSTAVSEELGVRFDVEGAFDWLVFLPTRSHNEAPHVEGVGALNRFYGKFSEPPAKATRSNAGQAVDHLLAGQLKVRGVEMRQRSAPRIVRQVQEAMLLELGKASDAPGFLERIPAAVDAVAGPLGRLRDGVVPLSELTIQKSVGKALDDYRADTETRAALAVLRAHGVEVPPGDKVRYVVLDAGRKDPEERVTEERVMTGDEAYDVGAYETLVYRAVESLLLPFGWDFDRVVDRFSGRPQARLDRFGVAASVRDVPRRAVGWDA